MCKCWKADPLQRPPIRNVCVMLDQLLDTGDYMCLTNDYKDLAKQEQCIQQDR